MLIIAFEVRIAAAVVVVAAVAGDEVAVVEVIGIADQNYYDESYLIYFVRAVSVSVGALVVVVVVSYNFGLQREPVLPLQSHFSHL